MLAECDPISCCSWDHPEEPSAILTSRINALRAACSSSSLATNSSDWATANIKAGHNSSLTLLTAGASMAQTFRKMEAFSSARGNGAWSRPQIWRKTSERVMTAMHWAGCRAHRLVNDQAALMIHTGWPSTHSKMEIMRSVRENNFSRSEAGWRAIDDKADRALACIFSLPAEESILEATMSMKSLIGGSVTLVVSYEMMWPSRRNALWWTYKIRRTVYNIYTATSPVC